MSKTMFYHTPGDGSQGVRYTIAGRVTSEGVIKLCACRCTEGDHFNKKKGRLISEGRLNSEKEEVQTRWGVNAHYMVGDDGKGLSRAFLSNAHQLVATLEERIQERKRKLNKK